MSCAHGYQVIPYNWYGSATRLEGDMCFTCLPGSYLANGDCKLCPLGRYQDAKSESSCKACAAGRYTPSGEGSVTCSSCLEGKTVLPGKGYSVSDCYKVCPVGQYGLTGSDECFPCKAGTFSDVASGTDACTLCAEGKAQSQKNQTYCLSCARGTWANIRGATKCFDCPPGSSCGEEGMDNPKLCPIGRYTDTKKQQSCRMCPGGRYQNNTGAAKCFSCPEGTFLDREGANSSSQCLPCPAGSYGDTSGRVECSLCPTGQVQPDEGQTSCKECALEGDMKTNNEARTSCVDSDALQQSSFSVVDVLFADGTVWVGAILIASLFVAGAAVLTYYREKEPLRLASLSRPQALYYSFLPGFSFGSWVFLVATVAAKDTALAVIMSLSRCLHFAGGILIVLTLFGDEGFGLHLSGVSPYMQRLASQRKHVDSVFVRENVYVVEMASLLSLCDVTMFRFIPWAKSEFFKQSEGFPSMTMMNLCLTIKSVETLTSVICDIIYLSLYLDNDSDNNSGSVPSEQEQQTQALFVLNIIFGVGTIVMDLLVLCVRRGVLTDLKEETSSSSPSPSPSSSSSSPEQPSGIELEDVYGGNSVEVPTAAPSDHDHVPETTNPMHAAALRLEVQQHKEALEAMNATNEELRKEIESLRRGQPSTENL